MKQLCILLLALTCSNNLLLGSTSHEFYIPEKLIPLDLELNTLLENSNTKKILLNKDIKRPSKCPLKNLQPKILHEKLLLISKAFQYGQCLDNNNQLLQGLESIAEKAHLTIQSMNNTNQNFTPLSSLSDITESTAVTTEVTETMNTSDITLSSNNVTDTEYYSNVMNYLGKISQDDDCVNNLKKQGFLSVLANIVTSIGQTSLLVPSPSGFLFSAAGIGFGSTLKVIAGLFKSRFNWSSSEERTQFQELNCSFFDLRREIEKTQVFETTVQTRKEKIDAIKEQISLIEAYKNKLISEQKEANQKIILLKENYYRSQNKLESYKIFQTIETFIKKTDEELKKQPPNIPRLISDLEDFTQKFTGASQETLSGSHQILDTFFSPFKKENLLEVYALEHSLFLRKHLNPILIYLKKHKEILSTEMTLMTTDFLNIRRNPQTKTNHEILKEIETKYISLVKKTGDTLVYLKNQNEILTNYSNKKDYDSYDDSSHRNYDIIKEYLTIQEAIYESLGYPYLKYFRKEIYDNMKIFKRRAKRFNFKKNVPPFKKELPWLCRNAHQLILNWQNADSASEVSWDFLETNIGLFYQDIKKIKFFLHLFPIARTKQYKLYRSARSAEIAKNLVYKNVAYHKNELNKYGLRYKKNLGKLMFDIKRLKPQKELISQFMEKNQCMQYL